MKRKNILALIALVTLFVMALTGCGSDEAPETTDAREIPAEVAAEQPLGLTGWNMNATTWSSPNGATINLTATPIAYTEGQSAAFIVRLEGEEVENVACDWDGSKYTAAAELNAADGYCYYVILTAADGSEVEVAVNTPTNPTDESLINMESSLNSYCNVLVETSEFDGGKLTLTGGYAQIQLPRITLDSGSITCAEAVLVLSFNGQEVAREALTLPESAAAGSYEVDLSGISFKVPDMEDDQQLTMQLEIALSNGQSMSEPAGVWFYNDGNLLMAVG